MVGSTEESAVDPVQKMVDIRDEFRERGMEFSLHVDGAWGGYFASMLREPKTIRVADELRARGEFEEADELQVRAYGVDNPDSLMQGEIDLGEWLTHSNLAIAPSLRMNPYVQRQYESLPFCDTITVDPHKGGMVVYPAGALCYRNGMMRQLIAFESPVVDHGDIAASVGFYGVEGSKPGASATAVYMSHSVIPADSSGYGQLLGQCMFASKRFYAGLIALSWRKEDIYVTPFQRLPAEKAGGSTGDIFRQRELITEKIYAAKDNFEMLGNLGSNRELLQLFLEMGSDQCIVAYTFNFRTRFGRNRNLEFVNEMNERMFELMSIQTFSDEGVPNNEMFVTASSFDADVYGQEFVDQYAGRIGIHAKPGEGIKFLISTQQNPWVTETSEGDYTPALIETLKKVAMRARDDVVKRYDLDSKANGYKIFPHLISSHGILDRAAMVGDSMKHMMPHHGHGEHLPPGGKVVGGRVGLPEHGDHGDRE